MSPEEKWRVVKEFYRIHYQIEWKKKLDEQNIQFLYEQMMKFEETMKIYREQGRIALLNLPHVRELT